MRFFQGIKKLYLGLSAILLMIGAEFINVWQMIRNTLVLALNLPLAALKGAVIFLGSAFVLGCFSPGNLGIGSAIAFLGSAIAFILIMALAYKLVCFLYSFVEAALLIALDALSCEKTMASIPVKIENAIRKYLDTFGSDAPEQAGHWIFKLPFVIHRINQFAGKVCDILQILVYPLSVGAGAYAFHRLFIDERTFSTFKTLDYILFGLIFAVCIGVFIWLGHEVVQILRSSRYSVGDLDEFFAAYGEVHEKTRRNTGRYHRSSQDQFDGASCKKEKNFEDCPEINTQSDNPYIRILGKAASEQELQKLYRSYAKKLHPDVCKEYSVEESTHRTVQLNAAYDYWKRQLSKSM